MCIDSNFHFFQDTLPAWIGGIGGVLGAIASILAVTIAARAAKDHVAWSKVRIKEGSYELVNLSKRTAAEIVAIDEISEPDGALYFDLELPIMVSPGDSFRLIIERTLASPAPTVARVTWRERAVESRKTRAREFDQVIYL